MSRIHTITRLKVLLQTSTLVPLTALSLRLFGFRRTYNGLNALARRTSGVCNRPDTYIEQVRARIKWIKRRGFYRGNCLSRSLTLWFLLQRQGIETNMRIGTRKQEGLFQAHAWVEYNERPLNAGQHVQQRYTTFKTSFLPDDMLFTDA